MGRRRPERFRVYREDEFFAGGGPGDGAVPAGPVACAELAPSPVRGSATPILAACAIALTAAIAVVLGLALNVLGPAPQVRRRGVLRAARPGAERKRALGREPVARRLRGPRPRTSRAPRRPEGDRREGRTRIARRRAHRAAAANAVADRASAAVPQPRPGTVASGGGGVSEPKTTPVADRTEGRARPAEFGFER